jgi:HD domain
LLEIGSLSVVVLLDRAPEDQLRQAMNNDVTQDSSFILDFWGKARANIEAARNTHPIVYHSLDVAAVGTELIARNLSMLRRIAAATGVEVGQLKSGLPFLLSLHDIGKYARVFQAKSPENWPVTTLGPYREVAPGNSHVVTGFQMLVAFSDAAPVDHNPSDIGCFGEG